MRSKVKNKVKKKHKRARINLIDFLRLIYMILVAYVITLLMFQASEINLKLKEPEVKSFDYLMSHSSSGFFYLDSNSRTHQNIIYFDNFNQTRLNENFQSHHRNGARFRLNTFSGDLFKEIYINEDEFRLGEKISSGYIKQIKTQPVLILKKGEFISGFLEAEYVFKVK